MLEETKEEPSLIDEFLNLEAAGGILLIIAALCALVLANKYTPGALLRPASLYPRCSADRHTRDRQAIAAMDQRRTNGDLFLPGRAGAQAGTDRR